MKNILLFFCLFLSYANISSQNKCNAHLDTSQIKNETNKEKFISILDCSLFDTLVDKKNIPHKILKQLKCLNEYFVLAGKNDKFRLGCTGSHRLPNRKIEFLAISNNSIIMIYVSGGYGTSYHLLMLEYIDKSIVDLYHQYIDTKIPNSINEVLDLLKKEKITPSLNHTRCITTKEYFSKF